MWKSIGIATCAVLLLGSCGNPGASGIYLATSDRMVTLIQIVESKDGVLTGRLEQVSEKSDGTVKDETIPLDGAASGNDLVFKPTSALLGGLQASGTLSGDHLTLTGAGYTLQASRSRLEDYQAAVTHLQEVATNDREGIARAQSVRARQAAEAQAVRDRQAAEARAVADAANETVTIERDTAQLTNDTAKMNGAIAKCPDFSGRAAANTARIAKMVEAAPGLSPANRGQLALEAGQVRLSTGQIEFARSQYAMDLNQIVQDAAPIAKQLEKFCNSPEGTQFVQLCGPAKAAAVDFVESLGRGRKAFIGYKQGVQDEINRQSALIRQING
jgi:hypothetical protein